MAHLKEDEDYSEMDEANSPKNLQVDCCNRKKIHYMEKHSKNLYVSSRPNFTGFTVIYVTHFLNYFSGYKPCTSKVGKVSVTQI